MTERSDYTWTDAARDLALLTDLTLREASELVQGLHDGILSPVTVHPYDALPDLLRLVQGLRGVPDQGPGYALNRLMRGRPLVERNGWPIDMTTFLDEPGPGGTNTP